MNDIRGNPIFREWIDLLEKLGKSSLVTEWAEKLCKQNLYHHGAWTGQGSIDSGKPYKEEFSCWNCGFRVVRETKLLNGGNKK